MLRIVCRGTERSPSYVRTHFCFSNDLDTEESVLALAREYDRPLALRLVAERSDGRLTDVGLS